MGVTAQSHTTSAPLGTGKLEKALGDLRKLPLLPATAQQAMALATNDSASLNEFTRLIERDITLAASILKLVNSPLFAWGRSIDTLSQAVTRLGLRECQNLMMAASMRNLFQQSDPTTKTLCAVLWKHCFVTGCLARRLNQELKYDYHGEEFLAGLLHDLGRILLAVTMPDAVAKADKLDFVEADGLLDQERSILGTDHCQFATEYANEHRLPFSVVAAIRHHHHFAEAKDHRGILALVVTADDLANHVQRGDNPEAYEIERNAGFQFLARGWTPERIAAFKGVVPRLIKEAIDQAADQVKPAAAAPRARAAATAPKPAQEQGVWGKMRSWF
jgi:HD-like signal output (HDOD) protein